MPNGGYEEIYSLPDEYDDCIFSADSYDAMGREMLSMMASAGRHSYVEAPIREFASRMLSICPKDMMIVTPLMYGMMADDMPQCVNVREMLSYMSELGVEGVTVPVRSIMASVGHYIMKVHGSDDAAKVPVSCDDQTLMIALAGWYASIDADFMTIFYSMPRGIIASEEVAAYLSLSSFIEVCGTAVWHHDGDDGIDVTLHDVLQASVHSRAIGIRTPISDIAVTITNDSSLVDEEPDYSAMRRLMAVHDGKPFVIGSGTSFESMESWINDVPYQALHTYENGIRLSHDLQDAICVAVTGDAYGRPVSLTDIASVVPKQTFGIINGNPKGEPDGALLDSFRQLVGSVNGTITENLHDESRDKYVAGAIVCKDDALQHAMVHAVWMQRMQRMEILGIVSEGIVRCCLDDATMHQSAQHMLDAVDAIVAAGGSDYDAMKTAEARCFGTYHNSVPRLMASLAASYAIANADDDGTGQMTYCQVSAADLMSALCGMRCAVTFADGSYDPTIPSLMNRYSEDIDGDPCQMTVYEMSNHVIRALHDTARIDACLTLPSVFLPYAICGLAAETIDEDGLAGSNADANGMASMLGSMYRESAKADAGSDDVSVFVPGDVLPNQLGRMIENRGYLMSGTNAFVTLMQNGVSDSKCAALVSALGLMELYACVRSHGGYDEYISDVGHVTALVHDVLEPFDISTDITNAIGRMYSADDEDKPIIASYHGAFNPEMGKVSATTAGFSPFDVGSVVDNDTQRDSNAHARRSSHTQVPYTKDLMHKAQCDERDGIRHGIGRKSTIDAIKLVLGSVGRNVPIIVGENGSGRMDLAYAIANEVANGEYTAFSRVVLLTEVNQASCDKVVRAIQTSKERTLVVVQRPSAWRASVDGMSIYRLFNHEYVGLLFIDDSKGYKSITGKYDDMASMFVRITPSTLSDDDVIAIVRQNVPEMLAAHDVKSVDDDAIMAIVRDGICPSSIAGTATPLREIECVDYAVACADANGQDIVSRQSVMRMFDVMEQRDVDGSDADPFHDVAGQDTAKRIVMERLRAADCGLYDATGPRNVFMFCGPSGCGKTLLASRIGRAIGVDDDAVLTLPMSEYSTKWEGTRLIGAGPGYLGYEDGGRLTKFIKAHPHGILILDELEKAHPTIVQMFLNMLDSGWIESGKGEHIDCHGLVIVCTSNAAFDDYESSGVHIGFMQEREPSYDERHASVREELVRRLGAPFVGRIPDIIVFDELGHDDLVAAMRLNYERLAREYSKRLGRDVMAIVTMDDVDAMSERHMDGMNKDIGVRGLWKQVEHDINNAIMDAI